MSAGGLLTVAGCTVERKKLPPLPEKPNILFIMTDDHAYQAISAYEGFLAEAAPTPNIDRLAHEGILFRNAFVTNSICAPCRATILTGKYSHLNGIPDNLTPFDTSQLTFPKILQESGYQTAMIGKWHLKTTPSGFDFWKILPGQGQYYNPDFLTPEGRIRIRGYVTDIITGETLNWLKNKRDPEKPFMIMCHHKAPHRTWWPGPDHLQTFRGETFPKPSTLYDDHRRMGTAARIAKMKIMDDMSLVHDLKIKPEDPLTIVEDEPWSIRSYKLAYIRMNPEQRHAWDKAYDPMINAFREQDPAGRELLDWKYQRYMEDYLRCIQSVDDNVGRLLDYLDSSGLSENTVIVYTSDQGFYLGEHGWFDKRFMYRESFHTPLIIKWPGVIEPGSVNHDFVMNLDFAETFLDMAGLPVPGDMQGVSFLPLLRGNTPENWRKSVYYHYYEYLGGAGHNALPHYGIRTGRYKLMHFYTIGEWELYDTEADPREQNNLTGSPGTGETVDMLKQQLKALREQYQVSGDTSLLLDYENKTFF